MAKKYDLVVVTGTYTTRDGNEKKSYETVGSMMEGERGPYLLIKRTFNFAAISPEKDSVIVSCFEPKQQGAPMTKSQSGLKGDDFPF